MVAYRTSSNPIQTDVFGFKVKVTMTQYPFFLYNSLLASLLWISALICPIKMKYGMSLRNALVRFVFEFHKNRIVDDVSHYDVI